MQRSLPRWTCKTLGRKRKVKYKAKCIHFQKMLLKNLQKKHCFSTDDVGMKSESLVTTGSLKHWDVSAEALEVAFHLCWLENTSDYIQILQLSGNGTASVTEEKSNSWYLWLWILPPRLPGSTPCHRKVSHSRKVTEISNNKDVKRKLQKWGRDREIFTGKFTPVVGNMPVKDIPLWGLGLGLVGFFFKNGRNSLRLLPKELHQLQSLTPHARRVWESLRGD